MKSALLDVLVASPSATRLHVLMLENELQDAELRVNEQMAPINGYPADQHPGKVTRDVHPEVTPAVELYLRRVFSRGESISNVEIQETRQAPLGIERIWLASFHPLRGNSGVISAISVVVLEITDGKRAGKALALSEARNRQLSPALAILDYEGIFKSLIARRTWAESSGRYWTRGRAELPQDERARVWIFEGWLAFAVDT